MKYLLKFVFLFLRSGVEAKRGLSSVMQCLQNSAESGKRSVLTLGSLCILCGYSVNLTYLFTLLGIQREAQKKLSTKLHDTKSA